MNPNQKPRNLITFYLLILAEKNNSNLALTQKEIVEAPTNWLKSALMSFQIMKVEYNAGRPDVNEDKITAIHIKAFERHTKCQVIYWLRIEKLPDFNAFLSRFLGTG